MKSADKVIRSNSTNVSVGPLLTIIIYYVLRPIQSVHFPFLEIIKSSKCVDPTRCQHLTLSPYILCRKKSGHFERDRGSINLLKTMGYYNLSHNARMQTPKSELVELEVKVLTLISKR